MAVIDFRQRLCNALVSDPTEPVFLGELPRRHYRKMNEMRKSFGLSAIKSPRMYIYPKVIEKLQCKRLDKDKLHRDTLLDIAESGLFDPESQILPTRLRHVQAVIKINDNQKTTNTVYLGEYKGCVSVKSIYINYLDDVLKQSLEGGG